MSSLVMVKTDPVTLPATIYNVKPILADPEIQQAVEKKRGNVELRAVCVSVPSTVFAEKGVPPQPSGREGF